MDRFIQRHQRDVIGVLNGWDRLMIRGTVRALAVVSGMMSYLSYVGVLLKDFGTFVDETSKRVKAASLATATRLGRPLRYLPSGQVRKEDIARDIAQADSIRQGLICVLSALEPCISYAVRGDRAAKRLVLRPERRKCLHYYHYWMHPDFGLMHVRLQTWFPFTLQVCLNGRSWLARQMEHAGLGYEQRDNCFIRLQDPEASQRRMDQLTTWDWPKFLDPLATVVNPALPTVLAGYRAGYYWSVYESEWATDILFSSPEALARIYPALVQQGITAFSSADVLRFLAKRPAGNFRAEVTGSYRKRHEGLRIKHVVRGNSLKMYDKQGSVLRTETTINNPHTYKVCRPPEGDPNGKLIPRRLRKGVADMQRRARLSQGCNERYLDAMASLDTDEPLRDLVASVCHAKTRQGRRVRALRPWSRDRALLQTINRGEFALAGFRNADLASALFPCHSSDSPAKRRASARVSRLLRILRDHGLIRKVPRERRYHLTAKGRKIATAILSYQELTLQQLKQLAA